MIVKTHRKMSRIWQTDIGLQVDIQTGLYWKKIVICSNRWQVRQILFKVTESKIKEKLRGRTVCMGNIEIYIQTGRQTVRMIDRCVYEWTDRQLCSDREASKCSNLMGHTYRDWQIDTGQIYRYVFKQKKMGICSRRQRIR